MSEAEAEAGASGGESAYWTRPVERKSEELAELQGDCFEAMWSWATCGGAPPALWRTVPIFAARPPPHPPATSCNPPSQAPGPGSGSCT
jgi:hypothetical protein